MFFLGKTNQKFLSSTWIHIIDSGGQPEFHDLLPIFIKNSSVVIFVLKACEALDSKPIVEYYDTKGCIGKPCEAHMTHKEILEQSLMSLYAPNGQTPWIWIIGTHKDCSPQSLDSKELQRILKPFEKKVFHFGHSRQPIAFINCLSLTSEDKEMLQDIQKSIEELTPNIEKKKIPLAWFGLEQALKEASQTAKYKGVLNIHDCERESNKFALFKNNSSQFHAAMEHFVENNIFLYYPEVLPDIVFCDPQVFFTLVTEIVRYHYTLKMAAQPRPGAMFSFEDSAFITRDIALSIVSCKDSNDRIIEPDLFLKLLTHLGIISPIYGDNTYLMPALLPKAQDPTQNIKSDLPPLCIEFDGCCAPRGLFFSLVASLLRNSKDWKLHVENSRPKCCFRNCVAFIYCMQATVTLVDVFSHYKIYVQTSVSDVSRICLKIRGIIYSCIEAFLTKQNRIKFTDAIECPAHHSDGTSLGNHLAHCNSDHSLYECQHDNALCGPIPQSCWVWREATYITGMFE